MKESTDDEIPKKRQKVQDAYCWNCHQSNTDRYCSTCIRSYHSQCIGTKGNGAGKRGYRCDQCTRMGSAKKKYVQGNVNLDHMHKMLKHITSRLSENEYFDVFGPEFSKIRTPKHAAGPNIVNPFDLNIIYEKVDEIRYQTTLEFINDIKWIRHNAEITLSVHDDRLDVAREMEEFCEREVYDIEMCSQCFDRANVTKSYFTEVCDPPHLLVWARIKHGNYWPAKVIAKANINKIDIRFFGDHEKMNVSAADCYLYSKNPNKRHIKGYDDKVVEEVNEYIQNIEEKYSCDVQIAKLKTRFDPKKIRKHLIDMIPGLNLTEDYDLKMKPMYFVKNRRPREPPTSPIDISQCRMCSVSLERCDYMLTDEQRQCIQDERNDQLRESNEHSKNFELVVRMNSSGSCIDAMERSELSDSEQMDIDSIVSYQTMIDDAAVMETILVDTASEEGHESVISSESDDNDESIVTEEVDQEYYVEEFITMVHKETNNVESQTANENKSVADGKDIFPIVAVTTESNQECHAEEVTRSELVVEVDSEIEQEVEEINVSILNGIATSIDTQLDSRCEKEQESSMNTPDHAGTLDRFSPVASPLSQCSTDCIDSSDSYCQMLENIAKAQNEVLSLKNELRYAEEKATARISKLEFLIEQTKDELKKKNDDLIKKDDEIHKLQQELQKMADEAISKNKSRCTGCRTEIDEKGTFSTFEPPACSLECLQSLWNEKKNTSEKSKA